jgi:hypothetical protein
MIFKFLMSSLLLSIPLSWGICSSVLLD